MIRAGIHEFIPISETISALHSASESKKRIPIFVSYADYGYQMNFIEIVGMLFESAKPIIL